MYCYFCSGSVICGIPFSRADADIERTTHEVMSVHLWKRGYSALEQGEGRSGKWSADVDFAEI